MFNTPFMELSVEDLLLVYGGSGGYYSPGDSPTYTSSGSSTQSAQLAAHPEQAYAPDPYDWETAPEGTYSQPPEGFEVVPIGDAGFGGS